MKKIIKVCSFFIATIFIILLASCNNNSFEVSCEARVTARRDKITVSASFVDSEKRIFDTVTPSVAIYNLKDGKENEQVDLRSLSIKSNTDVNVNTTSNEVTFENLEEYGTYIVKVLATHNSKNHTLFEQQYTLNNLGTKENPIKINNVESFLNNVPHDRTGYFELTADIDFNGASLSTMWASSNEPFTGTLDGKGFKLTNAKLNTNSVNNYGLFGYNKGTITNLTVDHFEMTINRGSNLNAGIVCGLNKGNIENVTVSNCSITGMDTIYSSKHDFNIGLLVGTISERSNSKVNNNKVVDSKIDNLTTKLEANVGGLVGYIEAPTESRNVPSIKNNVVENVTLNIKQEIPTSFNGTVEINVGGFVGKAGSIVRLANVLNTNIKLTTNINKNATTDKGLKGYNVNLAGLCGKSFAISNFKQASFKGELELVSTLKYDKSATEKLPETVFNANVCGLVGHDTTGNHEFLVSNVTKLSATITKENASGNVELTTGALFATTEVKDVKGANIINFADVKPTFTLSGDIKSNVSPLNNLSQDFTGFDEFVKNNFA